MKILTKVGIVAAAGFVVLLLGYAWLKQHDRWTLATAAAQHSADSLLGVVRAQRTQHTADSLVATRRVAEVQRQAATRHREDSTTAAAAIASRDEQLRLAREQAAASERGLGPLLDSLPLVVPEPLIGYATRVQASVRLTLTAKDTALARAADALGERDRRYASLDARYHTDLADRDSTFAHVLAGRDASYTAQRQQLDEANRQIAAGLKRTQPGLFARIIRAVPVVLGSIGAWELGKRIVGR